MSEKGDENKGMTAAEIAAAVAAAQAPLMEKIAGMKNEPAPPPKTYTRAELSKAVDDGTITEAQADDIIDKQNAARTEALVEEKVKSTITSISNENTVSDQIDAYAAVVPEVLVNGSEERTRVEQQYRYLVSIGLPQNNSTQLAALNSIFGTVEALKSSKNATQEFEHHQETGGAGGGERIAIDGTDLKLTADEKKYYQYLIDHGQMDGWKAVEDEMKFANKRLRQKHGRAA